MAAGLLVFPGAHPSLDLDDERVAATLEFFVNQTTTPKTVYADSGLTTPLSQPVESDAYGEFVAIWADTAQTYTAVWSTADGQSKTLDGLTASTGANSGIYDETVVIRDETQQIKEDTQGIYDDAVALYGNLAAVDQAVDDAQQAVVDAQAQVTLAAGQVALATTQAGNAATSAGTATTQAGIATTQAGTATTQAGIATTQAGNAATSATQAKSYTSGSLWTFSTTTTDSDPGSGNLRLNNANPTLATFVYVDNSDQAGVDLSAWLDTFDASSSAIKGQLYVREGASGKVAIYNVTGGVVDGTGYRKIPVSYVSGTGTAFTNAATIGVNFSGNGDTAMSASVNYVAKTSGYTVVSGDWGSIIDCTSGTFTLTYTSAATLGAGFYNYIRNSGTGVITGPTADGAVVTLNPGDEVIIEGDGSTFHALMLKRGGWTLFRTDTVGVAVASLAVTSIPQSYAGLSFEFNSLSVTNSTRSFQIEVSNNNGTNYSSVAQIASISTASVYNGMVFCPHYRADAEVGSAFFSIAATREALIGSTVIPLGLQHAGGMNAARFSFSLDNIAVGSVIKTWVKN